MPKTFRLSIVVPMHNEASTCDIFFQTLLPVLKPLTADFEVICIDDGSSDDTLKLLMKARRRDPRIKVLSLTRNFGKEVALTAGLEHSTGDAVIPIDADLQDSPEVISELVTKWIEGNDVVLAVRSDRQSDSFTKRTTAKLFYSIVGRIKDTPIPANAGDFRLMDKRVVEAICQMPERTRFMKGLFAWVGFKHTVVPYTRSPRAAGKTSWNYWRLWNFALEGLLSFTTAPLRIWTYLGFLVASFALSYMGFIVVRTILLGGDVPGFPTLAVLVSLFSGLNMIGLGILGEYLGRVFIEVKQRPLYLTSESHGFGKRDALAAEQPQVVRLPSNEYSVSRRR